MSIKDAGCNTHRIGMEYPVLLNHTTQSSPEMFRCFTGTVVP